MKLKKGDNVLVISGKDRGKAAKVLRSFPKEMKVLVEAINLKSKRMRPKKQGEKGQMIKIPAPIDISNVKFICPKCGKAARIGYKIEKDPAKGGRSKKFRVCKKCKSEV